jgi:anti-sigma regulatory factor (Ser/Thr protein kinase)
MIQKKISFELKNDFCELDLLCRNLEQFGKSHGLSKKYKLDLNLVLEELLTNIISHGYTDEGEHFIQITISQENGVLVVCVVDDGIPFNPVTAKEPDITSPLDEREIGGLGIHLIKQLVDDIAYERVGNRNILILKKMIS